MSQLEQQKVFNCSHSCRMLSYSIQISHIFSYLYTVRSNDTLLNVYRSIPTRECILYNCIILRNRARQSEILGRHGGRKMKRHAGKLSIMDEITIKTPNPNCRLYWCLLEFIDWRYSQSCWYLRPFLLVNQRPSYLFTGSSPPSPLPCVDKYRTPNPIQYTCMSAFL